MKSTRQADAPAAAAHRAFPAEFDLLCKEDVPHDYIAL